MKKYLGILCLVLMNISLIKSSRNKYKTKKINPNMIAVMAAFKQRTLDQMNAKN